jgi:endonuclease/exonuclease/phosphatase family metal-dependent hydrolase
MRGEFASGVHATDTLKVLNWNIERGLRLDGIIESVARERPILCIFQEVDLDARRTGRTNIAHLLARTLGMNYVWGAEFQELGQGDKNTPAYHGQATLTALRIRSSRVLRFARQSRFWAPRWFMPNWPMLQRRLGGRMALVAEIEVGGSTMVVYNMHLESRGPETLREKQLKEVLDDVGQYPQDTAIVVAGDFNTRSHLSPLVTQLQKAGFREAVNQPLLPTSVRGRRIDWIFVRGPLRTTEGTIHHEILGSDHFPVTMVLSVDSTIVGSTRGGRP